MRGVLEACGRRYGHAALVLVGGEDQFAPVELDGAVPRGKVDAVDLDRGVGPIALPADQLQLLERVPDLALQHVLLLALEPALDDVEQAAVGVVRQDDAGLPTLT